MLVYLITNTVNGKVYVGQTSKGLDERWLSHVHDAKSGLGFLFHRAIRRYTPSAFKRAVLWFGDKQDEASSFEIKYIAHYRAADRRYGYNLTLGGEGGVPNKETLAKLRQPKNEAWRLNISRALAGHAFTGPLHHSEATKKKIGIGQRNKKKMSSDGRAAVGAATRARFTGKEKPASQRQRMRSARLRWWAKKKAICL